VHFSHFQHVPLVQWTICLLPATGGTSSRPGGATHTLEVGLHVSAILLQSGGSPVEAYFGSLLSCCTQRPLPTVVPILCSTVPVYKPLFIWNKPVLSQLLSLLHILVPWPRPRQVSVRIYRGRLNKSE
jgi:hypothetical protein